MKGNGIHMIGFAETSLHALEHGLYNYLVALRLRLRKRSTEPVFDPELLDAYR